MNKWENGKMTATEIHEKMENKIITVPMYQRGIVWKPQQKKDLIDSIKRGLPFGSILLYKDETGVRTTYRLIDGLQRCKTVYEFISNPANYFDENDIDDEAIVKILKLLDVSNSEELREAVINTIIAWIKKDHETMDEISSMQYYNCARDLAKEFPALKGKEDEIIQALIPMLDTYKKICETMSRTEIPMIIIEGNDDALPIVFERINSKGSPLTKWQIYSATWSQKKIKISKELKDIVAYNRDRYEEMINSDELNIEDFDSVAMMNKMELDTFQMVYGFGKMISYDFPHLFGNTKGIKEVESIGFNLINACLGFRNSDIKNLHNNIREVVGSDDEINKFLLKILESIENIDKILAITKFKSNKRDTQAPLHTEMQVCSMIASYFINKYVDIVMDFDKDMIKERKLHMDTTNENWKQFKEMFEKNAIKTYFNDIISAAWKGSGDRKLNNIIMNPSYYTKEVDRKDTESILNVWYENVKNERNEYKKVCSPKEADKIILNVIYSEVLSAKEQIDSSVYDIEHLATKGLMRKQLDRFGGTLKLPISSIGNLCLLPEDVNRDKREKTIYQDEDLASKMPEIEKKFSFTSKEDLDWIVNFNLNEADLKANYLRFIDARFEKIREKVVTIFFGE